MIIEIYKSVILKLKKIIKNSGFNGLKIIDEEVEGTIIRPSIKLTLDDVNSENLTSEYNNNNLKFRLYFFAKDRNKYKLDNLKMSEILVKELTFIEVNDIVIDIEELQIETVDTVLVCSFSINYYEINNKKNYDSDNEEFMENLIYEEEI
ncbi:phage tail terminator family protein [Clostridium massiliamazoniense]|uniref:phage tail terminator family protein n=1 Tax=Clostridium massiliamazoniense TaxID=1347366 RepID=UPI0006D79F46|nr:hypothetical protein [Clostridium massiliamazoniense]